MKSYTEITLYFKITSAKKEGALSARQLKIELMTRSGLKLKNARRAESILFMIMIEPQKASSYFNLHTSLKGHY